MVKGKNSEISFACLHRLAKKSGIDRVSYNAAMELGRILEEIANKICVDAQDYMMHSARKTLKPEDITIAARKYFFRAKRKHEEEQSQDGTE